MLTFNLKKQWFEKIKSGEKIHEYRIEKYFWTSRFVEEFYSPKNKEEKRSYIEIFLTMLRTGFIFKDITKTHKICFMNGMEKEEKRPRMYAKFISIKIVNGLQTDLKINKPVYDIEFELVKG